MSRLEPSFGGPCWEEFKLPGGTVHCEEVYGHDGNHIGTEDLLVWTPEGAAVGGTLLSDEAWAPRSGQSAEDVDPDELGTFTEYLNYYTAHGGMTADERTAYWMGWTRMSIAWTFVLAAALVVSTVSGLVGSAGLLVVAYSGIALIWQVIDAARFSWRFRRGEK